MRRAAFGLGVLATAATALGLTIAYGPGPANSLASSHREAPLISEDPSADNTDLYAFRSPDNPDTLTIISNYIPGEDPAGGPNYYTFSPTARYNIYIDRDGDGKIDDPAAAVLDAAHRRLPEPARCGRGSRSSRDRRW